MGEAPGAVSLAQEMFGVGACSPAGCMRGARLRVCVMPRTVSGRKKGVQGNSDTEAKNLNKRDLNNRFS